MIEQKENDLVLNLLGNKNFSAADFKAVGLNATNTSLLDEETYKSSKQIQDAFQHEDGTFDNEAFHTFYENAQLTYNMLATDTFDDDMRKQQALYGKDNIFAPREQRRTFDQTVVYGRLPNPDRTTTGLIRVGETGKPTKSRSEIAQTQKVLVNPTEVYDSLGNPDWSKAEWHDAPNDSWFTDFFDTRVLAQWESDGEHIDPITGATVKHQKGEAKLNEEGTYYYENLDGRDVYGKQVLNKMNTLTTDGSKWNKYDFFDSDGLEQKTIAGSIMKNAALVGTMFIPYVGPWIAGLSVANQLVGLSGTLGKMLLGSDSPKLSALEGWSKSVNRQTAKSQYAMENTWCWENFINLIGDVAGQLKEQRVLFEFAPAMIKGNKMLGWNGLDAAKQEAYAASRAAHYHKLNQTKFDDLTKLRKQLGKPITQSELGQLQLAQSATMLKGKHDAEDFMKAYQHIGEILSKGYMTAITVGDTYGEAKYEAGASDIEATLLTLGYAAAEAALLNTGVGEWILPELKASGLKNKAIIKAVTEVPEKMRLTSNNVLSREGKKESAKYWFTKGKEVAEKLAAKGKGLAGQIISGGLGEGIEEMSEEFLADFSKSCFNTVQWLKGTDKRMTAWENMGDRYLMSLVGGAIGGGLTAAGTNFKLNNTTMSSEQAMQELIYMVREGKKDELFRTLDKMNLANPYLQFESETQSDGTVIFKPANSSTSNMDLDVKKAFINQVNLIDDIVKAEGLDISDNVFLDTQTFKDIRLSALQYSPVAGLFLQDFNTLCKDIVSLQNQINTLTKDSKSNNTPIEQDALNKLNKELMEKRLRKDAFLNGELAMDYTSVALFDLSKILSSKFTTVFFKDYVQQKYHKDLGELNEEDLNKYREEFENWKANEGKNDLTTKARIYLDMTKNSGMFIQEFAKNYDNIRKSKSIQDLIMSRLRTQQRLNLGIDPNNNFVNDQVVELDEWVKMLENTQLEESTTAALSILRTKGSKTVKDNVDLLLRQMQSLDLTSPTYDQDVQLIKIQISDLINKTIALNPDLYLDEFINSGAINPEIKHSLQSLLGVTSSWINQFKQASGINIAYLLGELNGQYLYNLDENSTLDDIANEVDPEAWYDVIGMSIEELKSNIADAYSKLGIVKTNIKLKDITDLKEQTSQISSRLDSKISALDAVTYTDTIQFIQNFIQTNSGSRLDMGKLLESVNAILDDNKGNLEGVNLAELAESIDEAIEVINWLEGLVIGAQTDSDANLNNLIGYNVTLNEIAKKHKVKDWEPLPTISTHDSHVINQDLELIKNKLIHAKNLNAINEGKKLNLQDRVATNKDQITYNRLKKFIVNVDDSWAEKSKLEEALQKATILSKFSEKQGQISEAEREAAKLEMLAIDNAFYDFFNNEENKKKIERGELHTIFSKDFDLYNGTSQLINESTQTLDDRNLLYWLASRASIKRSAFNNELRQVIDPEVGLAPIPTQQEATFQNLAEILNGDMMTAFSEAYRQAAINDWNKRSRDSKIQLLLSKKIASNQKIAEEIIDNVGILNKDLLPKYKNIFLTEGIPGAGKSKSVDYYTMQILKKFHGDILQNAWLANNTIQNAEVLQDAIGVKFSKLFDKIGLMSTIYSKYNKTRKQDEKGRYIYEDSEWVEDSNGELRFNGKSDDLSEPPSLIVIDEVSHYDQADLELLDDLATKYGISIITSGDFQQSTSMARNTSETVILSPKNTLFKHSPKLGVSMRTNNSQMDKTITRFQAHPENSKEAIDIYYYENEKTGFNGVRQLFSNEAADMAELDRLVQLMTSTLQEGEKIGYIYYDEESPVLKLLETKYSDKFVKFKGTSAQGREGQYYLVDFYGNQKDPVDARNDLYTGITRAEQGAIVLFRKGGQEIQKLNQHQETSTTKTGFSKTALKSYAIKTKKFLDYNATNELLTYIPRKKKSVAKPAPAPTVTPTTITPPAPVSVATTTVTNGNWDKPDNVQEITYKGDKYATDGVKVGKYISANEIELLEESDPLVQQILDIYNNISTTEPEVILQNETNEQQIGESVVEANSATSEQPEQLLTEDNTGLLDFTYLLHTHNTLELGMNIDSNRKLQFLDPDLDRYEHRIDSAIGLMKVFEADWKNPNRDADFYIEKLNQLRNALFNTSDKSDLIVELSEIFNPGEIDASLDVASLEFGLISAPNVSKKNIANGQKWGYGQKQTGKVAKYGILDRNIDEKSLDNEVDDSINRKTINAVIKLNNGKRISIPLFTLGNLETYTRDPKGPVSQKLKEIYDRVDGANNPYDFHATILQDSDLQRIPEIYNLARLWTFTNGAYFKIDDSSWTPAKNLKNYGIQVNTNAKSGKKYGYDGRNSFTPITNFIGKRGFIFSKQIYTSQDKLEDDLGNLHEFGHRGHAFVLVTQDPSLNTDAKMQEQYEKQILNKDEPKKVTLAYIMPPKVSIGKYLTNLYDLVNEKNDRSKIKKLGSHLTSYYIWSNIIKKLDDPIFATIDKKTKEKIVSEIERLDAIKHAAENASTPEERSSLENDLLNELLGTQTWEGVVTSRTNQSLQEHLNYQLLTIFSNVLDGSIIPENLVALTKLIESTGLDGIFYSVKFKNKIPDKNQILVPLQSDQTLEGNSAYTIDGMPFSINAKLDSDLFAVDKSFNFIIESFVSKILPADAKYPRERSSDTGAFVFGAQTTTQLNNDTTTITLEDNPITDKLEIVITPANQVFINGQDLSMVMTPDQARNIKVLTKEELKQRFKYLLNTSASDSYFDQIADKLYEQQIENMRMGFKNDSLIIDKVRSIVKQLNNKPDNKIWFFVGDRYYSSEFAQVDLQKVGLDVLQIDDDLYSVSEINYKGVTIRVNNGNVEIIKESAQSENANEGGIDWDNESIEPGSKIFEIIERNNPDYISDLLQQISDNGWDSVADIQGDNFMKEDLGEMVQKNPDDQELQDLLNYVAEDAEYCRTILRNI